MNWSVLCLLFSINACRQYWAKQQGGQWGERWWPIRNIHCGFSTFLVWTKLMKIFIFTLWSLGKPKLQTGLNSWPVNFMLQMNWSFVVFLGEISHKHRTCKKVGYLKGTKYEYTSNVHINICFGNWNIFCIGWTLVSDRSLEKIQGV